MRVQLHREPQERGGCNLHSLRNIFIIDESGRRGREGRERMYTKRKYE